MRHRSSVHPIGKCKGCGLNFRTYCGIFDNPMEMWKKGKCSGFMNQDLLKEYLAERETPSAQTPKLIRREVAKKKATEPHHQGMEKPEHSPPKKLVLSNTSPEYWR